MTYDAIIIGARCAGAATAMQLALGGMKVLLVDRAHSGTDTMSTHALMRGAVIQLNRWGLLDRVLASGAPEVTATRFVYGDESIDVEIRPAHGTRGLVAPRRYVLDRILADAAEAAGVETIYDMSFAEVLRDAQGRVNGAVLEGPGRRLHVRAPLLIGADGRRSAVARQVRAGMRAEAGQAAGCAYAYFEGLPDEGYRWYYREGLGVGAIPTHDGAHCVFASVRPERLRALVQKEGRDGALAQLVSDTSGSLAAELDAGQAVSQTLIFGGAPGFLREAVGPGWALVGDAGYFKDPMTAHGITDAFRDAEILAQTILAERPLTEYETTRDAWSTELFGLTNRMASFDWSLDELKVLHVRLNQIMKAEQAMVAGAAKQHLDAA